MADLQYLTEYAALTRHRQEMDQARRQRRLRVGFGLAAVVAMTLGGYWIHPALAFMLAGIGAMVLFFAAITGGSSVPADQMSGVEGEVRALAMLKRLPDEYTVFNQVLVPDRWLPNGRRELDFVVVGPRGICVVEVKNTPGLIYVNPDQRQWQVVRRAGCGSRPGWNTIDNPLLQVRSQVDALGRWLLEHSLTSPIRSVVCFARPDAALDGSEHSQIPVVLTESLNQAVTAPGSDGLPTALRQRLEELLAGGRARIACQAA